MNERLIKKIEVSIMNNKNKQVLIWVLIAIVLFTIGIIRIL